VCVCVKTIPLPRLDEILHT